MAATSRDGREAEGQRAPAGRESGSPPAGKVGVAVISASPTHSLPKAATEVHAFCLPCSDLT